MNKPRERTRQRGRQMGWVLVLVTAQRFAPLNIFSTLDTSWSHFCLGCLFFSDVTQQLLEHNTASHGLFPEIFLEIFLLLEKHSCLNFFFFVIFTQLFVIFVFFKLRFYSHSCAVFVPDDKMGNGKCWQRSNKHLLVFLKYNTTNICPGHETCPFECGFTNCEENLTEASVLCLNLTKKVNFFFSPASTHCGEP